MLENFPNLVKGIHLQIQDQQTSFRIDSKQSMFSYIKVKLLETKDKTVKAGEKNDALHTGKQLE